MRILNLTTAYPTADAPGSGIFAHRLNQALVALGAECHVLQPVSWAPPPPLDRLRSAWRQAAETARQTSDEVDGIRVHHPRVYKPVPSRLFPRDYWHLTGEAVAKYVARRPQLSSADVILAHFLCHEGYAGLVASRRLGIPVVAFALGDDVHAWPERWPDRVAKLAEVLAEADGLVANSGTLARDAAKWAFGGVTPHIKVVYHGVEHHRFTPAWSSASRLRARSRFAIPQDGRLLLCVAWLARRKGWLELLEALAAMRHSLGDWRLLAVSSCSTSEPLDLQAEAQQRGLADRLVQLTEVAPADMPAIYQAVDAFVLASHNEGLSNSVLEAMAAGLPVVATAVGGHAEIIDDRLTGRLVRPRDVPALQDALADVLFNTEAAAAMGAAARRRAIELGDFRTNAADLLNHLRQVVDKARVATKPQVRPPHRVASFSR